MDRGVDLGRADEPPAEFGGPGMEAASVARRRAPVDRVAEELVAEVEVALVHEVVREEDAGRHELVEGALKVLGATVHDAGEHVGGEAPPDHRTRSSDAVGILAQAGGASHHGVLDRLRDGRVADGPAVDVGAERPEQLFDVERNAIGPLVYRVDDGARSRQAGAEDQRGHESGVVVPEALQADFLGNPLGEQSRAPFAMDRAGGQLVRSVRGEQQQRQPSRGPGKLADDLEAQLVRPLQVLERQDGRPIDRRDDPVGHLVHEDPSRRQGVTALAAGDREDVGAEIPELRVAYRARQVTQGRQRYERVLGRQVGLAMPEPVADRVADCGLDDAGFADSGLAGEQEEGAAARLRLGGSAIDEGEHRVPADEERALELARQGHRSASVRVGIQKSIGHTTDNPRSVGGLSVERRTRVPVSRPRWSTSTPRSPRDDRRRASRGCARCAC